MKTLLRSLYLPWLAVPLLAATLFGANVTIHGVVTDTSGKPVRGAIVKATQGSKSVSRFTQPDGRYEIPLASGAYEMSVDAYGYEAKFHTKDSAEASDTNFVLAPKWNAGVLTGADITPLIPDDAAGRLITGACLECHDFSVVLQRHGMKSAEWQSFLPNMPGGRRAPRNWSPAEMADLGDALEKYFGPNAKYFGPEATPPTKEQINHPTLAPAVLKATFREYDIPTGVQAVPHTIFLDHDSKTAWFSEIGLRAYKVARFDIATETFQEFQAPIEKSDPHSGVVGKDGRVWITLGTPGLKIISIDPETNKIKLYTNPEDKGTSHTMAIDPEGNLWISGHGTDSGSAQVWSFNVKTEQFRPYKIPGPAQYPEGSRASWEIYPETTKFIKYGTYHLAFDSKGVLWTSTLEMGMITRIDTATGEMKEYFPPDVPGIRGIAVDPHDNVWFADYYHHRLGMLDQKTGSFKMYQPPTRGSAIYGVVADPRNGNIWYADQAGNYISRFDPATQTFAEYPIPTRGAIPRFIDIDKNGRVWFGEWWVGKIGVLDPDGGANSVASR
jgi:virginiamycin B lyase